MSDKDMLSLSDLTDVDLETVRGRIMVIQHNLWVEEHRKRMEALDVQKEHSEAQTKLFTEAVEVLQNLTLDRKPTEGQCKDGRNKVSLIHEADEMPA